MICAYEDCQGERIFEPKTHNQKYCSDECCRIATNQKLKDSYYKRKARLAGVAFTCSSKGCNNTLSRYTTDDVCSMCKAKAKTKEKNEIIDLLRQFNL